MITFDIRSYNRLKVWSTILKVIPTVLTKIEIVNII